MRQIRLSGLAVLVALAFVACGGGASAPPASSAAASPDDSAPAASSPAASSPAASAGAACEETTGTAAVTVEISGNEFRTDPVQAGVGDVIAWTNQDAVPHTATLDDDSCGTENLMQGQTGALMFNAAGSYSYKCTIHPEMTGTIEIAE